MMARPGVLFRFELLDALEQLDPADAGRLFLGAMRYGKDGTLPTFQNPLLSVVWPFIKTAADHDAEIYDSKILQKRFAVYVREAKKAGLEPMAFEVWKQSADITRCQPISGDIHNHIHTQHHNHSQIQEQEHTQENTAASPPAPARDSRNLVFWMMGNTVPLSQTWGNMKFGGALTTYPNTAPCTTGHTRIGMPLFEKQAGRDGVYPPIIQGVRTAQISSPARSASRKTTTGWTAFWQSRGKAVAAMGAKSQRKGRAAELELSRILQGHGYNVEPGRALSYGDVPDLSGLPGVHIECKRAEALRLPEWMAQAERDAQRFGDGAPAVFFRRSREPWCVVMKLENWIDLYKAQAAEGKVVR